MKIFRISLLALLFASAIALTVNFTTNQKNERGDREDPGTPYDDFMIQRIYPNKTFDTKAYLSGLNQAVSASRHTNYRMQQGNALNWQLEGPGNIGGRFNCIAVNPINSHVKYAGSANGGVWKTTNDGNSWFPVFDSIPFLAVGAITINPVDTSEIWVGTGDLNISGTMYLGNGIYKSNNSGSTWNYVGLANTFVISSIIINPANTNEILVATMGNSFAMDNNRGVYKSVNGGLSFSNVKYLNDSTGFIDMLQDPVNPSIIYASSFSRIRTEQTSVYTGTEVYLFKSTDFGQTWSQLAGGLPNGATHERLGIAIYKSNPDVLYAFYSTSDGSMPELYTTTNGGNTWSNIFINTFDQMDYGSYGWYFGKIYCDPIIPDRLFIPGVGLQVSSDGGSNWSPLAAPFSSIVHADGHYMYFQSSQDIIYCTDGGLYRTTDAGQNWTDIEDIPVNQFYAVTEDKNTHGTYAGGVQDNGTMYGNASGINNFTRLYGGDGFTVAYSGNPSLVYAEAQYGAIVFDDLFPAGNWNGLQTDFNQNYNWHTPYFLSPFSDDTLYFGGQSVMRIDTAPYGGYTIISPVLNDPSSPQRVSNISTINQGKFTSQIIYAGTADGKVWNTLNAGNTWNDITPFQGINYYVTRVMPSPNFASNVYVTRSGYRSNDNTPLVFKSTSNGGGWTNISGDLPMLAVNDIEVYPGNENILFIANDAGVYYTINGGIHWERLGDNMPFVAVLDIHLNFDNSRLIAGTFGRSMYTIDVVPLITTTPVVQNELSLDVFPNPVVNHVYIRSSKEIEGVSVYNSQGSKVMENKSNDPDFSTLPAGNYFIKIIFADKQEVVRHIVKL